MPSGMGHTLCLSTQMLSVGRRDRNVLPECKHQGVQAGQPFNASLSTTPHCAAPRGTLRRIPEASTPRGSVLRPGAACPLLGGSTYHPLALPGGLWAQATKAHVPAPLHLRQKTCGPCSRPELRMACPWAVPPGRPLRVPAARSCCGPAQAGLSLEGWVRARAAGPHRRTEPFQPRLSRNRTDLAAGRCSGPMPSFTSYVPAANPETVPWA